MPMPAFVRQVLQKIFDERCMINCMIKFAAKDLSPETSLGASSLRAKM